MSNETTGNWKRILVEQGFYGSFKLTAFVCLFLTLNNYIIYNKPAGPPASTHTGLQQLSPLWFEIKHHTSPGSWQSGASNEQDKKHNIGQCGGHPHYLVQRKAIYQSRKQRCKRTRNLRKNLWFKQRTSIVVAVKRQQKTTFPEVFTPFHRLKYTMVKMRKRQSISCQRTPPTSLSPDDLWISRTFLLLKQNMEHHVFSNKIIFPKQNHQLDCVKDSRTAVYLCGFCYSHLHALTCKIPLPETWRHLSRWCCPCQNSWCSRGCSTHCRS